MEIHYETRPKTNFVIGSTRAGQTVFRKFVRPPSIIPIFFRMMFFKGLCFGLKAYAVRLEALRALGSRNLEVWKASGLEVLKAWGVRRAVRLWRVQICLGGEGGGPYYRQ